MLRFTRQCRQLGLPFAADTSWQLARLDGDQVRELVAGAAYLFSNEYEAELIEHKNRMEQRGAEAGQVGTRVTTLGSAGLGSTGPASRRSWSLRCPTRRPASHRRWRRVPLPASWPLVSWGLSLERAARSWATCSPCTRWRPPGPRSYVLKSDELSRRLTTAYGAAAAQEIAAHLS